ncbi:ankyrin repeat-containing protein [Prunus yedoensis var. nudiflora]|uniref:Ankyrin repeat-containing protein n=1 Tax=Prunus yedoensis var. nudiflora TaxID=2094558 RepID=A0A314ULV8_PRUYE|nr:ankyrin repeat-containing protein [Prunus yedoensis var. nudiflora]
MLVQTIRYLLSFAVIRAEAIAVNGMSSIMSDVLEHSSIAREDSGILRRSEINNEPSPNPSAKKKKGAKRWKKKLIKCFKYPKKWLEESRGILMVVATVISTMTFQAVISPPGGVWQENNTNSSFSQTINPPYFAAKKKYV